MPKQSERQRVLAHIDEYITLAELALVEAQANVDKWRSMKIAVTEAYETVPKRTRKSRKADAAAPQA